MKRLLLFTAVAVLCSLMSFGHPTLQATAVADGGAVPQEDAIRTEDDSSDSSEEKELEPIHVSVDIDDWLLQKVSISVNIGEWAPVADAEIELFEVGDETRLAVADLIQNTLVNCLLLEADFDNFKLSPEKEYYLLVAAGSLLYYENIPNAAYTHYFTVPAETTDGYAGFADSWNYRWTYELDNGNRGTFGFSGLTDIDGHEYAIFKDDSNNEDEYLWEGEGYIRQSDGIVYTYLFKRNPPGEEKRGKEYILWNFNLEPGDVIEAQDEYDFPAQRVIDKWIVDIDGPKRALLLAMDRYSDPLMYTVVEGIGALEYGTMALYGFQYWKTGSAPARVPVLMGDIYLYLASVSDGAGKNIFEWGKTLVDYTPVISEDKVWEYGIGSGKSMSIERMAFRGTRTVNDVEYHCFGTLYRGPRVPVEGTESAVAFNPYLLREEFGKVYLLHTPGSYRVEEGAAEPPVESLLYDFTATDGIELDVFTDGRMEQGSVSLQALIPCCGIKAKTYTLWADGPVFTEGLGVLKGGNLVEFSKECTPETPSLRYVYSDRGDILYSAPEVPEDELKGKGWIYRSYMPGKYVDFEMNFSWRPTEIEGKNYYSFCTSYNYVFSIFSSSSRPLKYGYGENNDRFFVRQEGGRILMRVPEEKVWPFMTVPEGVSEVCLYDYELEEGESYGMFTTSGVVNATLISKSTEKVYHEDALLQVFELEDGKIIEVIKGLGNVTRGTYVTIEPDGTTTGNPEGITPADMLNPTEGYPAFLVKVYNSYSDSYYLNDRRFLECVESLDSEDGFIAPEDRLYDLQGRELREPVPGQPYIQGGKVFVETK